MQRRICPKCQGSMTEGVILDGKDGTWAITNWLEGAPEKGWLGLKLRGRKPVPIQTFRCGRCAYLESYAPD